MSFRMSFRKHFVSGLMFCCTLILALWLLLSTSGQERSPFILTNAEFHDFTPSLLGWIIRSIPVEGNDPAEPNILCLSLCPDDRDPSAMCRVSLLVRLVHGYNMPRCMLNRGYQVEPIAWDDSTDRYRRAIAQELPVQLWRVTSSLGEISLFATTVLEAREFTPVPRDIRSFAYPRPNLPDEPNWIPEGVTIDGFKHPFSSLREYLHYRWILSRKDVLAFLRLRPVLQPSDDYLSYVTRSIGSNMTADKEVQAIRTMIVVHADMLGELQKWRTQHPVRR